jgi:hypothetical protein
VFESWFAGPVGHTCPAGTVEPQPCLRGTYMPMTGAGDNTSCIKCSPGSYAPTAGGASCSVCVPGKFAEEAGDFECARCPIHGFCAERGASSLRMTFQMCPIGTFSDTPGLSNASQCLPCLDGHWCNQGQRFECARGSYTNASALRTSLQSCIACPFNMTTLKTASGSDADCVYVRCDRTHVHNSHTHALRHRVRSVAA